MKNLFFTVFILFSVAVAAQHEFHCATDIAMRKRYNEQPGLQSKIRQQFMGNQTQLQQRTSSVTASTYLIPIVFHIMHLGGPENVSDNQIRDAVRILNRDFAKQNPDTLEIIPEFKNLADSTKIQFAFPTIDPNGNCTNGIIHHYDADTDWNDSSPTLFSNTWDPTRYLNVYIVRTITLGNGFPAAGYTYYPGTFPDGDNYDAIVVLNNYMGSIGTSSSFLSRVLTHEAGHWFGLAHVFGSMQTAGIDCSDTDFINDTPPTIGYLVCPDAAVPSQYQVCSPGISENYQNYMDYSYCVRMFTQQQCQAMQFTLQSSVSGRDNLYSNSNLISTGVINPLSACAPIADFKFNRFKTCAGTPVSFIDQSMNGQPTAYTWSFPGGTPATSTFSAPTVTYANPGVYSVTHASSNSAGTSAPVTKTNIITVTNNIASFTNNWTEGFENGISFSNDWVLESTSGAGMWERTGTGSYGGVTSARVPRLSNTRKNKSSMTGPSVNISSLSNPVLTFKVAAAESVPNHTNFLKVYASTDCGNSWMEIYSKSSPMLVTSNTNIQDFVPTGLGDWRTEAVNLSAIQPGGFVNFKFEYVRDTVASANNIYIDNINIAGVTAVIENDPGQMYNLGIYPVPTKENINIKFTLLSKQKITFTLLDVLGRTLEIHVDREFEAGAQEIKFALTNSTPGIYFLRTETGGVRQTRKIIIED